MKMAAGRRGWKPRQALSQASTRSHWLARARHRGAKLLAPVFRTFGSEKKVGAFIALALRSEGQWGEWLGFLDTVRTERFNDILAFASIPSLALAARPS